MCWGGGVFDIVGAAGEIKDCIGGVGSPLFFNMHNIGAKSKNKRKDVVEL